MTTTELQFLHEQVAVQHGEYLADILRNVHLILKVRGEGFFLGHR